MVIMRKPGDTSSLRAIFGKDHRKLGIVGTVQDLLDHGMIVMEDWPENLSPETYMCIPLEGPDQLSLAGTWREAVKANRYLRGK